MAVEVPPRARRRGGSRGGGPMPLGMHLIELRKRITWSALGLVIGMVTAFFVTDAVIFVITEPLRAVAAASGQEAKVELVFGTVTAGFDLRLRMSFAIGLLFSAPVWLWQICAFIMPALTRKEILRAIGFAAAAIPLFFAGCAAGLVIMPHIVELMASFVPGGAASFYDAGYYYDFVFKLLLVMGIAFVLPVFLVALNVAGVMSGRAILRGWRIAILSAVVFAALATPAADVVSMLILSGIMILLFFAAAGVSLLFDRRRRRREAVSAGIAGLEEG